MQPVSSDFRPVLSESDRRRFAATARACSLPFAAELLNLPWEVELPRDELNKGLSELIQLKRSHSGVYRAKLSHWIKLVQAMLAS